MSRLQSKVESVPQAASQRCAARETERSDGAGTRPGAGEAAQRRLAELRRKLRRERAMGRCGHWAYSLTRHLALSRSVRQAEAAARTAEAPAGRAHTGEHGQMAAQGFLAPAPHAP